MSIIAEDIISFEDLKDALANALYSAQYGEA